MQGPIIDDNIYYQHLRMGRSKEFNAAKRGGNEMNLQRHDFRMVDLTQFDLDGLDLSGCYFRQADLRGLDLSNCNLDGSSIHNAKISGTLFPKSLPAQEIRLSHELGTRMRTYQLPT